MNVQGSSHGFAMANTFAFKNIKIIETKPIQIYNGNLEKQFTCCWLGEEMCFIIATN